MDNDQRQALERQKLSFEHQLKEVDLQALTAAERDRIKTQLRESLRGVNEKLAGTSQPG